MLYMTAYDLDDAIMRFTETAPRRAQVARTVRALSEWTDRNSDGWVYWPKPRQAAARAMEQIASTTYVEDSRQETTDLTEAGMTAVLRPIRAFCTRQINASTMTPAERDQILRG